MGNKKERVSVRITPNQSLVLNEMCEALNTSYSMLIRTIIGSWITENEERIYKLIDRKRLEKDPDYKVQEEYNNNLFDE